MINKVALYESELLDYAERLLSDEPLDADSVTAIGTLDMLDDEAIDLFKSVNIDNEYQGLEYYNTELNKEDSIVLYNLVNESLVLTYSDFNVRVISVNKIESLSNKWYLLFFLLNIFTNLYKKEVTQWYKVQ